MEEPKKYNLLSWFAILISLVAAIFSGGSLYWQKYMWDHETANLTVEQMGENDGVTSVMVLNSGRASVTMGGFTIRSQDGDARFVLQSATGPVVNLNESGGLVATQTAILPPGGLEYFVLSHDAVAYECIRKGIDSSDMDTFLTTGNGEVSFVLSESARGQISSRMSALR